MFNDRFLLIDDLISGTYTIDKDLVILWKCVKSYFKFLLRESKQQFVHIINTIFKIRYRDHEPIPTG